jgi:hypothetical protein
LSPRGVGSSIVRAMRFLVVVACLMLSCAAPPMPANAPQTEGGALTIENRGGPAFVVRAGDIEIARIRCNDGATVIPGRDSVPPLPWDLPSSGLPTSRSSFGRP